MKKTIPTAIQTGAENQFDVKTDAAAKPKPEEVMVQLNIPISREIRDKVKIAAIRDGQTMTVKRPKATIRQGAGVAEA